MEKYNNGKIYVIKSNDDSIEYIGSTINSLSDRLSDHISDYKRYLDGRYSYITSFEVLKLKDPFIVLLEDYPCSSKKELHEREKYWIKLKKCVNKAIPCRSKKEWYNDNKNYVINKSKKHYETNKETIKEKHRCRILCNCGSYFTLGNKNRHLKSKKHLSSNDK